MAMSPVFGPCTESSYNAGADTISVTTKMWRTFKSVRGTYFDRYVGKVEGTLGRYSYDFTSYDNRGNELDRVGATIMASGGLSIDLCTMAWEASSQLERHHRRRCRLDGGRCDG